MEEWDGLLLEENKRGAIVAVSAAPADSVEIIWNRSWKIEIDDNINQTQIKGSAQQICADHDSDFGLVSELVDHKKPFFLLHFSV